MINGIDGSLGSMQGIRQRENYKMSDEQKEQLTALLTNYNAEEMNPESMKSLMDEVKSLGIKPGDDMKNIMESAGFKRPEPPQGGMPPRKGEKPEGGMEMPEFMSDFIQKYQSGSVSEDDYNSFLNELKSNGYGYNGNFIDEEM